MRHDYKQGWFKLSHVMGRKWEITYSDGLRIFCEDVIVTGGFAGGVAICKGRIDAARSR